MAVAPARPALRPTRHRSQRAAPRLQRAPRRGLEGGLLARHCAFCLPAQPARRTDTHSPNLNRRRARLGPIKSTRSCTRDRYAATKLLV